MLASKATNCIVLLNNFINAQASGDCWLHNRGKTLASWNEQPNACQDPNYFNLGASLVMELEKDSELLFGMEGILHNATTSTCRWCINRSMVHTAPWLQQPEKCIRNLINTLICNCFLVLHFHEFILKNSFVEHYRKYLSA